MDKSAKHVMVGDHRAGSLWPGGNERTMPNPTAERSRSPSPSTQLLRQARALKLRPEHLDELIHGLAHELGGCGEPKAFADRRLRGHAVSTAERRAACINGGGLRSQVDFLLCHEGLQGSRKLLRQIAAGCRGRVRRRRQ